VESDDEEVDLVAERDCPKPEGLSGEVENVQLFDQWVSSFSR
jgi:hypothetical protein